MVKIKLYIGANTRALVFYYIHDRHNKVAFSIYDDDIDGDYTLDDYGIRDWFESNCTKRSISIGTITRSYKTIGL